MLDDNNLRMKKNLAVTKKRIEHFGGILLLSKMQ